MENKALLEKISELAKILSSNSGEKFDRKDDSFNQLQANLNKEFQLIDLLDYTIVCAKYRVFSEESALRENAYLKQLLENKDD
jgi:hypothetical protein